MNILRTCWLPFPRFTPAESANAAIRLTACKASPATNGRICSGRTRDCLGLAVKADGNSAGFWHIIGLAVCIDRISDRHRAHLSFRQPLSGACRRRRPGRPGILFSMGWWRQKVVPAVAIHAFIRALQADNWIRQVPEERCQQTPVWRHRVVPLQIPH